MSVNVRIPTPLRNLTEDREVVTAEGETVASILKNLQEKYPGLGERLCDEDGSLRRFVNVFVNDEDIRYQDGPNTVVNDGDEISIIPAIAGG